MGMTSYHRGVIAGMELAMRICRNRASDRMKLWTQSKRDSRASNINAGGQSEALICADMIRVVQVEIGSWRMKLPEFTLEEQDEINRIR